MILGTATSGGPGSATWGGITGTLSDQTDLSATFSSVDSASTSQSVLISADVSRNTSQSILISAADSKAVSAATLDSTTDSTALSRDTSQSILISSADSKGVSAALADSVNDSSATSRATSLSTIASTNLSTDISRATSLSTVESSDFSTDTSRNTSQSTLISTADSKAVSAGAGVSGAKYTICPDTGSTTSPADTSNYFFGANGRPMSTTEGNTKMYIPVSGTLTAAEIFWFASTAAGSNESFTMYVRYNGTTDITISAVSDTSATKRFTNTGLSQSVSAGDYLEIKIITPAWGTNPTGVQCGGTLYIS